MAPALLAATHVWVHLRWHCVNVPLDAVTCSTHHTADVACIFAKQKLSPLRLSYTRGNGTRSASRRMLDSALLTLSTHT